MGYRCYTHKCNNTALKTIYMLMLLQMCESTIKSVFKYCWDWQIDPIHGNNISMSKRYCQISQTKRDYEDMLYVFCSFWRICNIFLDHARFFYEIYPQIASCDHSKKSIHLDKGKCLPSPKAIVPTGTKHFVIGSHFENIESAPRQSSSAFSFHNEVNNC